MSCEAQRAEGKIRCTLQTGHDGPHRGNDGRMWKQQAVSSYMPPALKTQAVEPVQEEPVVAGETYDGDDSEIQISARNMSLDDPSEIED